MPLPLPSGRQVNGLFFAIGHEPASKFLGGQLELDEDGYIKTTPGHTTTNVPGRCCPLAGALWLATGWLSS
jgi:alkyl hydroperoxide reductase subunit AhpF